MQPCKLATGSLIGSGILPPGQFLNVHKIRVDSDNKRLAQCTKMPLTKFRRKSMNKLIGTSPLGLAVIKHKNEIIARKGLSMGANNINGELRSTVAKQEAMTALQQKEFHATTAQQAKRTQSLNCDFERTSIANPKGKPLSKIISGAACLAELTSNPKSFSNCPDLHGGVPDSPGGSRDPRFESSFANSDPRLLSKKFSHPSCITEPTFMHRPIRFSKRSTSRHEKGPLLGSAPVVGT
jgi:hypothetical protein